MEILTLNSNEINQNGYHINKLTRNKIGFIYIAPANIIPDDCLACDGYVLKISDYKKLYSAIGTLYNSGTENDDEFRIPDYNITGRFLQPSKNIGQQISAGLPNITATWQPKWGWIDGASTSGAITTININRASGSGGGSGNPWGINFNASRSSSIYGNSTTVQPPAHTVHLCIKYK